jgi:hypothetical protein
VSRAQSPSPASHPAQPGRVRAVSSDGNRVVERGPGCPTARSPIGSQQISHAEARGPRDGLSQGPMTAVRKAPSTPTDLFSEAFGPCGSTEIGMGAAGGEVSASPANVGIYQLTSGITTYAWLCKACVEAREAAGWSCKRTGTVTNGWGCDDCHEAEGK